MCFWQFRLPFELFTHRADSTQTYHQIESPFVKKDFGFWNRVGSWKPDAATCIMLCFDSTQDTEMANSEVIMEGASIAPCIQNCKETRSHKMSYLFGHVQLAYNMSITLDNGYLFPVFDEYAIIPSYFDKCRNGPLAWKDGGARKL